jgi:hypothetical protein
MRYRAIWLASLVGFWVIEAIVFGRDAAYAAGAAFALATRITVGALLGDRRRALRTDGPT